MVSRKFGCHFLSGYGDGLNCGRRYLLEAELQQFCSFGPGREGLRRYEDDGSGQGKHETKTRPHFTETIEEYVCQIEEYVVVVSRLASLALLREPTFS